MRAMPESPWSPFIGPPWTTAQTWFFAMMLAEDRALSHRKQQRVRWDAYEDQWRIEDVTH